MSSTAPYLGQDCVTPYPRRQVILRSIWLFVQSTVFRWSPRPLHGFRAWILRLFGAKIPSPSEVVIFPSATICFPWKLRLEPRSMIGRNVTIYNLGMVILEFGANVSQNTHLCAGSHDFNRWAMPLTTASITIGRNAWIAADVFVGPGVTIGELAVVGARSVVVTDLPARMICVGHPCRPIKARLEPSHT